jgi:Tol biopolymer transport system component
VGLYRIATDLSTGQPERVFEKAASDIGAMAIQSFTPDPNTLLVGTISKTTGFDVMRYRTNRASAPLEPVLNTPFNERYPAVSPDGAWLAYASNVTRQNEVYLRPYGRPGPVQMVSKGQNAQRPTWSRDGTRLFYSSNGAIYAVQIDFNADTPIVGQPTKAFELPPGIRDEQWALAPDGDRLLIMLPLDAVNDTEGASQSTLNTLQIVFHWSATLNQKIPTAEK